MARAADGGRRKGKAAVPAAKVRPPKKLPKATKAGYVPPKKEKYVPPKEEKAGGYVPVPTPVAPEVPEPTVTEPTVVPAPPSTRFSLGGVGWTTQQPGGGGEYAPQLTSPYTGAAFAEEAARQAGGYVPYTAPTGGGIRVGRYVDRYGRPTAGGAGGRAPTGAPAMGGGARMTAGGATMIGGGRIVGPGAAGVTPAEMVQPAAAGRGGPVTAPAGAGFMAMGQYPELGPLILPSWGYEIGRWILDRMRDMGFPIPMSAEQYGQWGIQGYLAASAAKRATHPYVEPELKAEKMGKTWKQAAPTYYGGYGGYGGDGGGGGWDGGYTRATSPFSLGLVNWRIGG